MCVFVSSPFDATPATVSARVLSDGAMAPPCTLCRLAMGRRRAREGVEGPQAAAGGLGGAQVAHQPDRRSDEDTCKAADIPTL